MTKTGKKLSTEKGLIYKIFSPSKNQSYIGSTFLRLRDRETRHRNHYKLMLAGKAKNCTAHKILQNDDSLFECIKSYDNITKRELLDEETRHIMFLKEKEGDNIVNKNNSGITLNMSKYAKEYKEKNKDKINAYQKKYRESHKDYFKDYFLKHKEHIKELKNKKKQKNAVN